VHADGLLEFHRGIEVVEEMERHGEARLDFVEDVAGLDGV